jgi:hypothetical protein
MKLASEGPVGIQGNDSASQTKRTLIIYNQKHLATKYNLSIHK